MPLNKLLDNISQALEVDDIVEFALATRSDCISSEYAAAIDKLFKNG